MDRTISSLRTCTKVKKTFPHWKKYHLPRGKRRRVLLEENGRRKPLLLIPKPPFREYYKREEHVFKGYFSFFALEEESISAWTKPSQITIFTVANPLSRPHFHTLSNI